MRIGGDLKEGHHLSHPNTFASGLRTGHNPPPLSGDQINGRSSLGPGISPD